MKVTAILTGAFAAFAAAAPTARGNNNVQQQVSQLNDLQHFSNQNFDYLATVNNIQIAQLEQLASQNLDILSFQNLFSSQSFSLSELLQLAQLQMLLEVQSVGLLNGFDLSSFNLNAINLGLINNVGGFDVNSLIDQSLAPQITAVIQQSTVLTL